MNQNHQDQDQNLMIIVINTKLVHYMYIRVYNYSMQIRSYNTNLYTWNPNDICFGQLQ